MQSNFLNLCDFVVDLADVGITFSVQNYLLDKRKVSTSRYIFFSILLSCYLYFFNNYIPGMSGIISYKFIEVLVLTICFYQHPIYKVLVPPLVCSVLQLVTELTVLGCLTILNPNIDIYSFVYDKISPLYVGLAILARCCFAISSFVFAKIMKTKNVAETMWLIVIPVISVIIGLLHITQLIQSKMDGVVYIFSTALIIVVNIVTFYLLNVTAKATQALAKEQSTKTIEGLKEEQYKRLMETNEEARKWKHDIKNHIYTSIGFLQEGHPKDAETYLTNLVGSIQTSTFAIQSGNAILDAVLSTKISECIKKDITVHLDISIPDKYMKSIDVCSIIGNLMDNAINACELLPNDNRDIWIRLKPTKTFITLTVKNPIPPKETELARKERQKGELHGIGLKQIEKRVANYNGIYLQVIENNLWVANVSIPLETDVIWLKTYCGTFGGGNKDGTNI